MPTKSYVRVTIADMVVQVDNPEELPISINYALEEGDDFTKKVSGNSLDLSVPATLINDSAANLYRNPSVRDMTSGNLLRGNQRCIIESNGNELLVGKAFLKSASHTNKPGRYLFNLYGDNADWIIDLKESTIYDFVKQITFDLTQDQIIQSWGYDGTNENLPFVFAPVRYRNPFDDGYKDLILITPTKVKDFNMNPMYMKPSLSIYWILYWGFKSIGYRISSDFFDTDYFRRMVMPWTWGSFLKSEGTSLSIHNFLAKSTEKTYINGKFDGIIDMKVTNDSTNGAFDNNDDYTYNNVLKRMEWTYNNNHDFGILEAHFAISLDVNLHAGWNSDAVLKLHWWRQNANGTSTPIEIHEIAALNAPALASVDDIGIKDDFYFTQVRPGDKVFCQVDGHIFESKTGFGNIWASVLEFKLDYFRIPIGGTVHFENFTGFKNYKFLDLLKGVEHAFNLSFNTDPTNRVVYFEPTHPHSLTDDVNVLHKGYFNGNFNIWDGKEDFSKEWLMENFSDYEKELSFRFKDDSNDGILKVIQDRNLVRLTSGKYILPDRFKEGKKEIENPFFAPLMHYEPEQWKTITGESPQIPVMVPENISNTSESESDNTFAPKMAYYKGNVTGVGGWVFDNQYLSTLPFMFAVNYKQGGENDPILSFSDEKIKNGTGFVLGRGLLKRFYWQRLANMRNGQWYNCFFRLNNSDVANQIHRDHKVYGGEKWELVNIKSFRPLVDESTSCLLRKWSPLTIDDQNNTYPTSASVLDDSNVNKADLKYSQLKCLISDIPTE